MATPPITLEATLHADGMTVRLDEKVAVPPGRVTVTVQRLTPRAGPTMLEVLDRIHRDQQQRAHRPKTEEETAADTAQRRLEDDAYDERWRQIWSETAAQSKRTDAP
jgi:hypothetical protein